MRKLFLALFMMLLLVNSAWAASNFEQFMFSDSDSDISFEYSLFVPENSGAKFPLLIYIPDATAAGKSAREIVENYYGAYVWISNEDQSKHPAFVLVPAFCRKNVANDSSPLAKSVVDDNWNVDPQVDALMKLVSELMQKFPIDANRIYTTGQSMGCMSSLYLNSKYPDFFAASMYVSGQWDISVLGNMTRQKFFYITAGGDQKASGGQDEVIAMLEKAHVNYSYVTLDAKHPNISAIYEQIARELGANMIRFETGSVMKPGYRNEHMASFEYAYKLDPVRDWLFRQSK